MAGAGSPEELDALLEDALIADPGGVAELFEDRGVVVVGAVVRSAAAATTIGPHLAGGRTVSVSADLCVVVGGRSVAVCRRGPATGWRIAVFVATRTDDPAAAWGPD